MALYVAYTIPVVGVSRPPSEVRLAECGSVVGHWADGVARSRYVASITYAVHLYNPGDAAERARRKTLLGLIATLGVLLFAEPDTIITDRMPHRAARQRLTQDFNPALVEHFKNGWLARSSLQVLCEEIESALCRARLVVTTSYR